jgi:hypothetical protein
MIVGRIDLRVVARGVDGRHDGEKRRAGIKLAQFGPLSKGGAREG